MELNVSKIEWKDYLNPGVKVVLRVTCKDSKLFHRSAISERVTHSIKQSIKNLTSSNTDKTEEEENDIDEETQLVVVRLYKDFCTISIDSTGNHLHKRGYRVASTVAPLRENIAASMIVHSGWDKKSPLIDPFCGSGTIPIEAALMASGIPVGRLRSFSFTKWPSFDQKIWDTVKKRTKSKLPANLPLICGGDILSEAVRISEKNATQAGVSKLIKFQKTSFEHFPKWFYSENKQSEPGWIISNLPFGKRTDENDIKNLYIKMGNVLHEHFPSWNVLFMVSTYNENLIHHMGIEFDETETKIISNGGINVKLKKGIIPNKKDQNNEKE